MKKILYVQYADMFMKEKLHQLNVHSAMSELISLKK